MSKKKSSVQRARERRDNLLKRRTATYAPLSETLRTTILNLVREGATLSEVFTIRGIASYGAFYFTRTNDEKFDADVRIAMAQGSEAAIAEAAEYSRQALENGNPDDMRVAEAFHRCALTYAEKSAPREFGTLVKLGGPDGGAISLNVVSYAVPVAVGKVQEITEASRARIADAEFDEVADA